VKEESAVPSHGGRTAEPDGAGAIVFGDGLGPNSSLWRCRKRRGTVQWQYDALIGKDWQSLDQIGGDEFVYNTNTAGGASTTKSAFVDPMKSGAAVVRRVTSDEATVRRYGEVALVTGTAHVDVTLKGEDKTLHSRYLHIWRMVRTGNWLRAKLLICPRRNSKGWTRSRDHDTHLLPRLQAFSAR